MLGERFRREKPREVAMLPDSSCTLVFTDGASEADCHTIGGVLGSSGPMFHVCWSTDGLLV